METRLKSTLKFGTALGLFLLIYWAARTTLAPQPRLRPLELPSSPARKGVNLHAPAHEPQPSDTSETQCAEDVARVSDLALQVAESCEAAFARDGLCPAPVAFPPGDSADAQSKQIKENYRDCDLLPGDLVVDCSEYPCLTLVSRGALERDEMCSALRELAKIAPSTEENAELGGLAMSSWVPSVVVPPIRDPDLHTRVASRAPNRFASLGRRLATPPQLLEGGNLPDDCGRVKRAWDELHSADACDALRNYWDCPSNPVSEDGYQKYVDFATGVLDRLLETCPHLDRQNTFLDCSSTPCLIVVNTGDQIMKNGEAFCYSPDLFSFTGSGLVPNIKVAVAFLEKVRARELDVRERFEQESAVRVQRAIDAWEAQAN